MSILITGISGFIGHNLSEYLLTRKYSILCPSHCELDLIDPLQVEKYFKDNKIETVVHCATVSRNGTSYPPDVCEKNLRMFFNIEKYKSPAAGLINLGSGSEYARKYWRKKMPEEYFGAHIPEDGHSCAKYAISKYIQEKKDDNIICLRIFGIYGKYEYYLYKFISNCIVKNIFDIPIVINQNAVYDYIYITDFCKIIEYFINNIPKNKIFNVTPTQSVDLIGIANIVNAIGSNKSKIQVLNAGFGSEYSGNNTKLLSEMGGFNFIPHEDAIAELYKYYIGKKDSLDFDAIKKDTYLEYAKKLYAGGKINIEL